MANNRLAKIAPVVLKKINSSTLVRAAFSRQIQESSVPSNSVRRIEHKSNIGLITSANTSTPIARQLTAKRVATVVSPVTLLGGRVATLSLGLHQRKLHTSNTNASFNQAASGLTEGVLFNARNSTDIRRLDALIDSEIAVRDEKDQPLNSTFSKMVEWLKIYVNNPDFLNRYTDNCSLELTAEATFWSVKLKLEPHFEKMSYAEIKNFRPLSELFARDGTERSLLIDLVCQRMKRPAMSHEASYALQQAAGCVYVRKHSFAKLQEEESRYNSEVTNESVRRSRM